MEEVIEINKTAMDNDDKVPVYSNNNMKENQLEKSVHVPPDNKNKDPEEVPEKSQRFEEVNKAILRVYAFFGVVAVQRKNGVYVVNKFAFIVAYLFWITLSLVACQGFLYMSFDNENEDNSTSLLMNDEVTLVFLSLKMIYFFIFPTFHAYSLVLINTSLPQLFEEISRLCDLKMGFKTPLKVSKIRSMPKDATNSDGGRDYLFFWFPFTMIGLSNITFAVCWTLMVFMSINFDNFDWPFCTIQFTSGCLPLITNSFVTFFMMWHASVYRELKKFMESNSASWDRSQIRSMCLYLDKLQDIFYVMDYGFFRYTLGINLTTMCISSIACAFEVLQGQLMFLLPLSWYFFILQSSCKCSSIIMTEVCLCC